MPFNKRRKRKSEDETSYWLSYSDMMAALLLVFVLIISFTMLQSKRQYEEKEAKLQEQQSQLNDQQDKLDTLMEESLEKESEIEEKDKLIAEQQEKLDVFENWESERAAIVDENKELEAILDATDTATLKKMIHKVSVRASEFQSHSKQASDTITSPEQDSASIVNAVVKDITEENQSMSNTNTDGGDTGWGSWD